jgi:hypothetical protein
LVSLELLEIVALAIGAVAPTAVSIWSVRRERKKLESLAVKLERELEERAEPPHANDAGGPYRTPAEDLVDDLKFSLSPSGPAAAVKKPTGPKGGSDFDEEGRPRWKGYERFLCHVCGDTKTTGMITLCEGKGAFNKIVQGPCNKPGHHVHAECMSCHGVYTYGLMYEGPVYRDVPKKTVKKK